MIELGGSEAVRETGVVLLNECITTVNMYNNKRLVLPYNNNTTLLSLLKFMLGSYQQKIILLVAEQQAFTYASLEEASGCSTPTIQRTIKFLLKLRLIRLWGWRYNPNGPHTKIYLVDGGDESRAQALKKGKVVQ